MVRHFASNRNMRPWESRGYAPDISGIAPTPSRITVKQNGYTVYSKMVPAGPYRLDDLRPMGNGDLVVTVEDEVATRPSSFIRSPHCPSLLRRGSSSTTWQWVRRITATSWTRRFILIQDCSG
ncbi:fimbria/pilus outer membrane usher protein [Escherichia coli]|uniref:fimbria/pilus outer membrane usher protein n=1 Tax=Escherichia coli TaxID=562 RepID=UPI002FCCB997